MSKRIVIATSGTFGDVEPFAALAAGLRERGHAVAVSSNALYRGYFERRGFEFFAGASALSVEDLNELILSLAPIRLPLRQLEVFIEQFFLADPVGQLERQMHAMKGCDLVVCHWLDAIAQGAAERLGLPWVSGILSPLVLPSDSQPPFPFPNFGRRSNAMAWALVERMIAPLSRIYEDALARAGLPRRSGGGLGPMSPYLNLVAVSPHLVAMPKDWPDHVHVTGHWAPVPERRTLDDRLARFLDEHPAPVVVSFGSLGSLYAASTGPLVEETSRRLGGVPMVCVGVTEPNTLKSSTKPDTRNDSLFFFDGFVPYELLFPRASCVVHHAGQGTCLLAVRAGVPSIPVPHLWDQGYWATELHRRGVSTRPMLRRDLTAPKLERLIKEATGTPSMKERAHELGTMLGRERGVERAVELIEAFFEFGGRVSDQRARSGVYRP